MKDEIKRIHEYVWARHIDGSDHYDHSISEEEAIAVLNAYYSEIGNRNSTDQVYLGILLFERAFEYPEQQAELFGRAQRVFEFYRRVTGETDWPAVEDRLEDIRSFFEEEAAASAVTEPAPPSEPPGEPPAASAEEAAAAEPGAKEPATAEPPAVEAAAAAAVAEPPSAPVAAPVVAPASAPAVAVEVAEGAVEAKKGAEKEEDADTARREAAEAFVADLQVVEGMQLVPAGSFIYGIEELEVFLDTFYIDRRPVTNAEYMRFVREMGYRPPRYANDERLNRPEQPVVGISYGDARQFARWAGKELPTERQWEKAARGTDGRPYPWGNDPPGASDACFDLDPMAGAPKEAGSSLRNVSPFGVEDMCGNVWEWTSSRFAKDSEFQVVRGGSYNDPAGYLTVSYRLEAHPKDKCEAIGFRCVKNIHP